MENIEPITRYTEHEQACSTCGVRKTLDCFRPRKKSSKNGLNGVCRECQKLKEATYRASNRERIKEDHDRHKAKFPDRIKAAKKGWKKRNPDRVLSGSRKRYYENIDKMREKARARYWKDPSKMAALSRAWARANAERKRQYRISRRPIDRIRCQQWRKNNPEATRKHTNTRRAREIGASGSHTADDIKLLFLLQNGKCAICRHKLPRCYHVDHIQPLSKGGGNERENLQLLCPSCNTSKHAKDPIDHMQSLGFLL